MAYRLSEEHPLQPIRVQLAVELIRELGLVEFAELVPPRVASDEEIALCHSPRYIELVKALSDPGRRREVSWDDRAAAGFASPDNPVADGMHEACATIVGGSIMAAEAVHSGAALHTFNPA